jgi:broad specificity phosphatase PhoE
MKRIAWLWLSVILLVLVPSAGAQDANITTIILVRHAEQDRSDPEQHLTQAGQKRAKELARVLKHVPLAAIYSTNTARTKETAKPTSDEKKVPIMIYEYVNMDNLTFFTDKILGAYRGKTILISGHSDDVPTLVTMFLKEYVTGMKVDLMKKEVHDSIFVVSLPDAGKGRAVELKYGEPSPPG